MRRRDDPREDVCPYCEMPYAACTCESNIEERAEEEGGNSGETRSAGATKKVAQKAALETVLVLRTCAVDGSSSHGFSWPESGLVEAPDWKNDKDCGHGLHGWLWGAGDWSLKIKAEKIKWLVLEVEKATIVDLGGKVKFPRAVVVAVFLNWWDAMKFIRTRHHDDESTNIATGDSGHASATGYYGHASATGDSGWSACGYNGKAKAKDNGVLTLLWWDGKRPRVIVAYVGEDGIKPDTWYCVKDGKIAECAE